MDKADLLLLEIQRRYAILSHMLNLDPLQARILQVMIADEGAWRRKTLADHLHLSRTTVRRHLKAMQGAGLVDETDDGVFVPKPARQYLTDFHLEFCRVLSGLQQGLSAEILDQRIRFDGVTPERLDELRTVRFPRLPDEFFVLWPPR